MTPPSPSSPTSLTSAATSSGVASPLVGQMVARVRVALVIAVAVLATAVALIAYVVSFEAISAFVVRIGAFRLHLGWAGPLLVDSFITIGTAFLLWLSLTGAKLAREWDAWFAWALIALATTASAYLNGAHAPDRLDARIVAGGVPVVLLASVELLVRLMVRVFALATIATPATPALTASATVTTPASALVPHSAAPVAARKRSPRAIDQRQSARRSIADTRPVYERLVATGQPVTWQAFAIAFDPAMPRRTAQRHLAAHQATAPNDQTDGQRSAAFREERAREERSG